MSNKKKQLVRKSNHPNFDLESNKFVCSVCKIGFDTKKEHANHIFENHTQEFASTNLPTHTFHRLYKTEEWKRLNARRIFVGRITRQMKGYGFSLLEKNTNGYLLGYKYTKDGVWYSLKQAEKYIELKTNG